MADKPDLQLFGEKLRRAPIKVKVDAALVVSAQILQVIGKPGDGGKLVPGLRTQPGIDCSGTSNRACSASGRRSDIFSARG